MSFFLLRAGRGRIGEIEESMRIEVAEARWLPLDDAPRLLAYGGEREMAAKARDRFARMSEPLNVSDYFERLAERSVEPASGLLRGRRRRRV